jgi:hypothetical protein
MRSRPVGTAGDNVRRLLAYIWFSFSLSSLSDRAGGRASQRLPDRTSSIRVQGHRRVLASDAAVILRRAVDGQVTTNVIGAAEAVA